MRRGSGKGPGAWGACRPGEIWFPFQVRILLEEVIWFDFHLEQRYDSADWGGMWKQRGTGSGGRHSKAGRGVTGRLTASSRGKGSVPRTPTGGQEHLESGYLVPSPTGQVHRIHFGTTGSWPLQILKRVSRFVGSDVLGHRGNSLEDTPVFAFLDLLEKSRVTFQLKAEEKLPHLLPDSLQ